MVYGPMVGLCKLFVRVDVKGMVIDLYSKDAWEIDIGEEYIGSLEGDLDLLQDVNMSIMVDCVWN